jgi:histone acetyltransferase (RNA polymerase elongator complex component)
MSCEHVRFECDECGRFDVMASFEESPSTQEKSELAEFLKYKHVKEEYGIAMTEDEECKHGLMPNTCASCKHGPEINEPERIDFSFNAKFDSQCPECDLPITEGQRISKTTKDRYLHTGCQP